MANEIQERIDKGISLLDDRVPNWREVINLDVFNIKDCDRCIIGQLFHTRNCISWGDAVRELNINVNDAWKYGFDAATDFDMDIDYDSDIDYEELNKVWLQVLTSK